jgi:hypothetical protein
LLGLLRFSWILIRERRAAESGGLWSFDGKRQTTQAGKAIWLSDEDSGKVIEVGQRPTRAMGEFCSAGEFGKQEGDISLARVEDGVVPRFASIEFPVGSDELTRVASVEAAVD